MIPDPFHSVGPIVKVYPWVPASCAAKALELKLVSTVQPSKKVVR